MSDLITAEAVSKRYEAKEALKGVSFSVEPGQIIGLLGPNGAGKTTLLKAILGLTTCQGGLTVMGKKPRRERVALMKEMSFIADVAILPRWLKVKNAIDFVEGVHPAFDRAKAMGFIEKTTIPLGARVGALSKGMVAQLHLALVMAIDVKMLILDEPTLGLDIMYRKRFYQSLLDDYYTEDRTIIITTHQVEEVESILTDVMMLDQGRLILNCSMDDFHKKFACVQPFGQEESERLRVLKPLSEKTHFGQPVFLFEDQSKDALDSLGTMTVPAISDVFVAKVEGAVHA
jgi:ABC-2 type transport system ATP-binding protein